MSPPPRSHSADGSTAHRNRFHVITATRSPFYLLKSECVCAVSVTFRSWAGVRLGSVWAGFISVTHPFIAQGEEQKGGKGAPYFQVRVAE
ncbi:hypothetical protein E2C01_096850 [Portunus trituberculatus]|uniref:Uncharacterized protein n=1 Tax=Portunus trituberculatus TaxID=210409 RepID=A0A5B7K2V0_PORTR|nr:hypothetical protein [Portunus trituberculatus]